MLAADKTAKCHAPVAALSRDELHPPLPRSAQLLLRFPTQLHACPHEIGSIYIYTHRYNYRKKTATHIYIYTINIDQTTLPKELPCF